MRQIILRKHIVELADLDRDDLAALLRFPDAFHMARIVVLQ